MKTIYKILAACDFSKYTDIVLETAVEFADCTGAELVLLNVINQRDIDSMREALNKISYSFENFPFSFSQYRIELESERLNSLRQAFAKKDAKIIKCRYLVKVGVPFQMIIETIVEEKADLLVMGTKGRTNLGSILLGSTAEKLFRHCPIRLLSVRLGDPAEKGKRT